MIGESWQKVRFTLFPLGDSLSFPAQAMTESRNMETAIEFLRGTSYYFSLSHAMERFNTEQSLFPLEVSLDLEYWRELWRDVNRLDPADKKQALRLIGAVMDQNNLMWALRYRMYHHLSEEEIINYTLSAGYHVKDEDIRTIAAGGDPTRIIARIYPTWRMTAPCWETWIKSAELELRLQRHTLHECQEAFSGYPSMQEFPLLIYC